MPINQIIRLQDIRTCVLDAIAAYLQPVQTNLLHKPLTPERLPQFHHTHLTDPAIALELQFRKLTHTRLIQLRQLQYSLIGDILILNIECQLISGYNCGHKLTEVLIIELHVQIKLVELQGFVSVHFIRFGLDLLCAVVEFLLFLLAECEVLVGQGLEGEVDLAEWSAVVVE